MAFFEVPRGSGGITVTSQKRNDADSSVLRFNIPVTMLDECGCRDAQKACVKFGYGRDLGTVLIIPTVDTSTHLSVYALSDSSKTAKSMSLSSSKIGIEFADVPALPCSYEIGDGLVTLKLPAELMDTMKFNSTGRLRNNRAEEMDALNRKAHP